MSVWKFSVDGVLVIPVLVIDFISFILDGYSFDRSDMLRSPSLGFNLRLGCALIAMFANGSASLPEDVV